MVISIGIGLFIKNYKSYILVLISRLIGTILSVICSHLFINTYASSGYFKPFTAFGYTIFFRDYIPNLDFNNNRINLCI